MCEVNKFGASVSQDFEKNIEKLRTRNIRPDCSKLLTEIWEGRHDYHHLKPKAPIDREKLQTIAKNKMIALHGVESEVFAFEWVCGTIEPKHPKYWPKTNNGHLETFLRFEP
jgi:hypothetical protein